MLHGGAASYHSSSSDSFKKEGKGMKVGDVVQVIKINTEDPQDRTYRLRYLTQYGRITEIEEPFRIGGLVFPIQ